MLQRVELGKEVSLDLGERREVVGNLEGVAEFLSRIAASSHMLVDQAVCVIIRPRNLSSRRR